MNILFDDTCEELAFPRLFSKRKFGYTFSREHHFKPTKYFNHHLLNFSQTVASNSDYIFLARSVWQKKNVKDQIPVGNYMFKAYKRNT